MDCGHARNFQRRNSIEDALPFGDEVTQLAGLRLLQERFQIGARDEDRSFRGGNNQTAHGVVAFDRIDMFAQLAHGRGVENVRARFGPIECEHADAIVTNLASNHRTYGHCRHYHQFVIVSVKFQARRG